MNYENISFDRGILKSRAKVTIKNSYWKCFVTSLLLLFVAGGSSSSGGSGVSSAVAGNAIGNAAIVGGGFELFRFGIAVLFLPLILIFVFFVFSLGLILSEVISAPLMVGGRKFYLEATQNRFNLGNIGFGFSTDFINIVKTSIIKDVYVFLWTCLLIVPGIIKFYSYYLVEYILAENPHMNYKKALALSTAMTDGYKMEIWILSLSFIGWTIAGALCFGVGIFFIQPYIDATNAEMYLFLRARALDLGIVSLNDLR